MILITKVEYLEVPASIHTIMRYNGPNIYGVSEVGPKEVKTRDAQTEIVRGRRFVNPQNHQDVVIGMAADPAGLIGLQYEAWETQDKEITKQRDSLCRISDANFWRRLKWLFTGVQL